MCKYLKHTFLSLLLIIIYSFILSQNPDHQKVVAKPGDGIFSILRENGYNPHKYLDEFVRINQNKILKNNELMVGSTYYLPLREEDVKLEEKIEIKEKDKIKYIKEYKTIVAKQGDGIFGILREHGLNPHRYIDNFIELNKDNLLEDNALKLGAEYYLPVKVKREKTTEELPVIEEKIDSETDIIEMEEEVAAKPDIVPPELSTDWYEFRYAEQFRDNRLQGAMIYLIAGHGGPDPGAIAEVDGHTISEDEYAYDICMRIARRIEEHGGKVVMIIKDPNDGIRDCRILPMDQDEYCYPNLRIPRNHMARLRQRVEAVNKLHLENQHIAYQRVLDVHLDSRSSGQGLDVFFYHYPSSRDGRQLARTIRDVFNEKYAIHQPSRGYSGTVSGRNLYVIRQTTPPAVLIELGNIQNPRDQRRFLSYRNRQALANWIVEGIIRDYENFKKAN